MQGSGPINSRLSSTDIHTLSCYYVPPSLASLPILRSTSPPESAGNLFQAAPAPPAPSPHHLSTLRHQSHHYSRPLGPFPGSTRPSTASPFPAPLANSNIDTTTQDLFPGSTRPNTGTPGPFPAPSPNSNICTTTQAVPVRPSTSTTGPFPAPPPNTKIDTTTGDLFPASPTKHRPLPRTIS